MFIDYLTVMMVAVVAGAVLTIVYGLMFLEAPSQTRDRGGGRSQLWGCCSGLRGCTWC
jgi:hypothetical protein